MATIAAPATELEPTAHDANWARHSSMCRSHSGGYLGYFVIQTVEGSDVLTARGAARVLAYVAGAGNYGRALELAHEVRARGGWAVVASHYQCGCVLW